MNLMDPFRDDFSSFGHRSLGDLCLLRSVAVLCWLSESRRSLLLYLGLTVLNGTLLDDPAPPAYDCVEVSVVPTFSHIL